MGCCGNDLRCQRLRMLVMQLSNVQAWEMEILHLTPQTIVLSSKGAELLCCTRQTQQWRRLVYNVLPLLWICCCHCVLCGKWCKGHFEIWLVVVVRVVRVSGLRQIYRNPIGIAFQTTSKCGVDPIWKIAFRVVFCWPYFLKSIWIWSGYAKRWIWAGNPNKAKG